MTGYHPWSSPAWAVQCERGVRGLRVVVEIAVSGRACASGVALRGGGGGSGGGLAVRERGAGDPPVLLKSQEFVEKLFRDPEF